MVFPFYRRPLRIFFFLFVYFLILTKSHSNQCANFKKICFFFFIFFLLLFRKFRSLCHTRSHFSLPFSLFLPFHSRCLSLSLSLSFFLSILSILFSHVLSFRLAPLSVSTMTTKGSIRTSLALRRRRRTRSPNGGVRRQERSRE